MYIFAFHVHVSHIIPSFQGVLLYSEKLKTVLPNNSLIASSDIGAFAGSMSEGIACYTAAGSSFDNPDYAVWENSNGENIRRVSADNATSLVFFTQPRPKRLTLLTGGVEFSLVNEGVYSCHINDENRERQTLLVGIYTPDTFINLGIITRTLYIYVAMETAGGYLHIYTPH